MHTYDFEYGKFYTREAWKHSSSTRNLALTIPNEDSYATYYDDGYKGNKLSSNSHVRNYNDFIECTKNAKIIKTTKEPKMEYKKTKIVVTTSEEKIYRFETEEDALEKIADILEDKPRTKFTMFKPYQKVEPKRITLADLITAIKP